jgi:hypothetical protein
MTDIHHIDRLISWFETTRENADLAIQARQRAEQELALALSPFKVGDLLEWSTRSVPGRKERGRVLRINGVSLFENEYHPTYTVELTRKDGVPRYNGGCSVLVQWMMNSLEKIDESTNGGPK